jgi:predicted flap endonuclease-1-like 5' DNA nuclease
MIWLNIIGNITLLLVAETLVIVVGSMLMGVLLSYVMTGNVKKQVSDLQVEVEEEKRKTEEIRNQIEELIQLREHLKDEVSTMRLKSDSQSRTIYDQQLLIATRENENKSHKGIVDSLNATIDSYQHRLKVIGEELSQVRNAVLIPHQSTPVSSITANYDHVSKLLGKPVIENDLSVIYGIGPKTSALLQSNNIQTWQELAQTSVDLLKQILTDAGGTFKSIDPSSWPKQAYMAAQSEWRKLRVYQESLKKSEG